MTKRALNERVNITGWGFAGHSLRTYPRRMEFQGNTYTFNDGLGYLVRKGESVLRIFDMSDGRSDYRLTCDETNNDWTLVAITSYA